MKSSLEILLQAMIYKNTQPIAVPLNRVVIFSQNRNPSIIF